MRSAERSSSSSNSNEDYDHTLYESRSAWKIANDREDFIMAAAGDRLSDSAVDHVFWKAEVYSRENGVSRYDALLKTVGESGDKEAAYDALDSYINMSAVEEMRQVKDKSLREATGLAKFSELNHQANRELENDPYSETALSMLDEVIESYVIEYKAAQNKGRDFISIGDYMQREFDRLTQKAQILERQGKLPTETEAATWRGIRVGLAALTSLNDEYEDSKKVLESRSY